MGLSQSVQAQFWKKITKRVQERVEETVTRKVENKAEQNTENALDSLFNKKGKKSKESADDSKIQDMMGGMMTTGHVKTETMYRFPITATMIVENYHKKQESNTLKQSYGEQALLSLIDDAPGPVIHDLKNNSAIILNPEEQTARIMSLAWMQKMMGDTTVSTSSLQPKVTKTGQSKLMNGYTCFEYTIAHEKTNIIAWFAPEVDFNYQDYMRGFSKMFSHKKTQNPVGLLNSDFGYVMQMTAYKKGKKTTSMTVIELSKDVITYDLSQYTIQKMF